MTGEQWLEALERIEQLVTGYLAGFRAYQIHSSWDDICQEVLIELLRSARREGSTSATSSLPTSAVSRAIA